MLQCECSRRTVKSYILAITPPARESLRKWKSAAVAGEKRSISTVPNSPVDHAPPVSSIFFFTGWPLLPAANRRRAARRVGRSAALQLRRTGIARVPRQRRRGVFGSVLGAGGRRVLRSGGRGRVLPGIDHPIIGFRRAHSASAFLP